MSVAELRRRVDEVNANAAHLAWQLPLDSPHNAVLRSMDIARYIGHEHGGIVKLFGGRRSGLPEHWQVKLSQFFYGWDHGNLVKARIGNEWLIVNRHTGATALAQMAAPSLPQAHARSIAMRIEVAAGGPKLKGR